MSTVKSFSVGNGDMFYIRHGSNNLTIIDCCLTQEIQEEIVNEIEKTRSSKDVTRFISTHPDEDHIRGLKFLDDEISILNFYCVANNAIKSDESESFQRYCSLRDDRNKAFYIYKGCTRKWMNEGNDERGSSGLSILWPDTSNKFYQDALKEAEQGFSPNNISPIIQYHVGDIKILWLGDLESDFMENIAEEVNLPETSVVFAPHHGRDSGKLPLSFLQAMKPKIIVVGEAPAANLNYYPGFNTITQNSAGNIIFECNDNIDVFVSSSSYRVDFLEDLGKVDSPNKYYIGSLIL